MPTAEEATHSEQTVDETPPATTTADEAPLSKEKENAADTQEVERWKGRLKKVEEENKRLKKALVDEEETPAPKPVSTPVTSDSIEAMEKRLRWELKHEDEIALAEDEYNSYRKKNYSEKDSLRLAHLDKGIAPSNLSEHLRQKATASAPSTVDRTQGAPIEGASESIVRRLKAQGRSDDDIRRVVAKAQRVMADAPVLMP